MNILRMLLPKVDVDFVYDDFSLRQALEKMNVHHYSTVPVIERKSGKYIRSLTDGDILRVMLRERLDFEDLEKINIGVVPSLREYKPVSCYAREEDLLHVLVDQNYVPVVDDKGAFIGIVTRKTVLTRYIKKGG